MPQVVVPAIFSCMKGWSWNRAQAALLVMLLGVGMSLSFVQGSVTPAEMAVLAMSGHHGTSGCDDCSGDHHEADVGTCLPLCGAAAQGLMPGEPMAVPSASRMGFHIADLLIGGQISSPDHGPPKILTPD